MPHTRQSRDARNMALKNLISISEPTSDIWIYIWSLYYHHILAAGKLDTIDSNKIQPEGTIKTHLMWDNLTEIKLNIGERIWLKNTESK